MRLTTTEAAAELRCHEKTVRRMIRRGDIPAVLVAGRWLIEEADLPTPHRHKPTPPPRPRRRSHAGSLTALVDQIDAS